MVKEIYHIYRRYWFKRNDKVTAGLNLDGNEKILYISHCDPGCCGVGTTRCRTREIGYYYGIQDFIKKTTNPLKPINIGSYYFVGDVDRYNCIMELWFFRSAENKTEVINYLEQGITTPRIEAALNDPDEIIEKKQYYSKYKSRRLEL